MYSQKGFHFHEQGVPQKQKIYMFLMGPIQLNGASYWGILSFAFAAPPVHENGNPFGSTLINPPSMCDSFLGLNGRPIRDLWCLS